MKKAIAFILIATLMASIASNITAFAITTTPDFLITESSRSGINLEFDRADKEQELYAEDIITDIILTESIDERGVTWDGISMDTLQIEQVGGTSSTQSSATLTISPSTAWTGISASGGTRTVTVTTNVSYTVSMPTWISRTNVTGGFRLTAAVNPSAATRSGTVSVTGGGITRSFSVSQVGAPPHISLSPSTNWTSISASGATRTVTVTTNIPSYTVNRPPWMTLETISSGVFRLTAPLNQSTSSRSGTFSVTNSFGLPASFSVSQLGAPPTLTLNPSSDWLNISAWGATRTVTVTTNIASYHIQPPPWMTFVRNGNVFTLIASDNLTPATRTGVLAVTGDGITRSFNVSQKHRTWHAVADEPENINKVGFWPGSITVGYPFFPGYVPHYIDIPARAIEARSAWANALGVSINETSNASASIQVFGGSMSEMHTFSGIPGTWIGYCSPATRTNHSTFMLHNVERTVQRLSGQAQVYLTYHDKWGQDWSLYELRSIAVHEFGHALGYFGHALNTSDIMHRDLQPGSIGSITPIEATHLRQIYDAYR